MTFGQPVLLWLLALVVPAAALIGWSWRVRDRAVTQFVAARLISALVVGVSKRRRRIRASLLVLALALALFSLARPQWGFDLEEARQRGLDLVIAIDTSKSMLADDIPPNRLSRSKLAALDLMKLARSDRLGLVAFAGSAFLQCPLSLDDEAFRQSVEALDVNIIPQGGSALGEAIAAALSAFKEQTDNHKILVILTDGEDNDTEGAALEAARAGAKQGLRIFTIGVGTPNGELLATTDPYGNRVFIKDAQGNVVKSRLNEALLQQLAKDTEGFYLPLSGARTMDVLYERGLAPLPKSEFAARTIRRQHERFQWFVGAAILLLLAEMLFPERVKPRHATTKRPAAAVTTAAMLMLCLLPFEAFASASDGLKQYQRGNYAKARQEFERLAQKSPDDPRLRFNAGAAAFQDEDYETALKHFSASLSSTDLPLQGRSYYNLGNTQFRLGEKASDFKEKSQQWEQAIQNYENAVKLDPMDVDAGFNLDVVKKKLEELKKQQQQQQQQQQQDQPQDDKQDQQEKDERQKSDPQKQEQENKDQPQDSKGQDEKKEEQPEQQKQQDQQQPQSSPDQQKQDQQQAAQDQRGPQPEQGAEAGEAGRVAQMTPQQAMQLLEAQKAEEKTMIFQPVVRTNRPNNRVFKDW